MRILISGASGLVGSNLSPVLKAEGHTVVKLSRSKNLSDNEIGWDPLSGEGLLADFEGFDAVINLSGENIGEGIWTAHKKQNIYNSRVIGTQNLCKFLGQVKNPPKVLINASAMGFYGSNRGDEILTEESGPGTGFLAKVCQDWEAATTPAQERGIRVVCTRFGLILSERGGLLPQIVKPFKLGFGGVLGDGEQYMSWVTLEDVIRVIQLILVVDKLNGPLNVCTSQPVKNEEFTKTLGDVLNRPTFFSVPAFALRLLLGEKADELLLSSVRMVPRRLHEAGFEFEDENLHRALEKLI